jgi:hypothetical protein
VTDELPKKEAQMETTVRGRILLNQFRDAEGRAMAMVVGYQRTHELRPATSGWLDLSSGYGEYPVEAKLEATRAVYRQSVADHLFMRSNGGSAGDSDEALFRHRSMSVGDVAEIEIKRGVHVAHVFKSCEPTGWKTLFYAPVVVEAPAVR